MINKAKKITWIASKKENKMLYGYILGCNLFFETEIVECKTKAKPNKPAMLCSTHIAKVYYQDKSPSGSKTNRIVKIIALDDLVESEEMIMKICQIWFEGFVLGVSENDTN